jgi:hypothetical protein
MYRYKNFACFQSGQEESPTISVMMLPTQFSHFAAAQLNVFLAGLHDSNHLRSHLDSYKKEGRGNKMNFNTIA